MSTEHNSDFDPMQTIAIVGMAGRYPGSRDLDELWQHLKNGDELVTFFTREQMIADGVPEAMIDDENYVGAASILPDIDKFDAAFFNFSPKEAEMMDPQQRFFLECCWEALERAGYDPSTYEGSVGVFAGATPSSYLNGTGLARLDDSAAGEMQSTIGSMNDYLTTRVSYKLNLRGPSLNIQTACSTSLVAITTACQSLLNYQCDIALAGGASVRVPQKCGYIYDPAGYFSTDGHCRTFDHRATGTLPGNAVGVICLKRYEDAVDDGDTVLALIRGAAVNNDGSAKVGYSAPSVPGQAKAIAMAQALAEVDADTITNIEAHGTATPVGDPIEFEALTQAFRATTERQHFCALGSIKSNLGHTDATAGVTGVIKTVLSMQNQQLPPSLHYEKPNPKLQMEGSPFFVNTQLRDWNPEGGLPRRGGVSSFGVGGTNAHVVMEEAPPREAAGAAREQHLVVLSARTASALDTMTRNLAAHLRAHPDLPLAEVAHTLAVGRSAFEHRRGIVVSDGGQLLSALEAPAERMQNAVCEPAERPLAFVFNGDTGSVAQGLPVGLFELLRQEGSDALAEDDPALEALQSPPSDSAPALVLAEVALASLLRAWGHAPRAAAGQGLGMLAAACDAGALSLDDALKLASAHKNGNLGDALAGVSWNDPSHALLDRDGRTLDAAALANVQTWNALLGPGAQEPPTGALAALLAEPGRTFVEIGPGRTLTDALTPKLNTGSDSDGTPLQGQSAIPTLPGDGPLRDLVNAILQLWISGREPQWSAFYAGQQRQRVELPTYPFERKSFWPATAPAGAGAQVAQLTAAAQAQVTSGGAQGPGLYEGRWQLQPIPGDAGGGEQADWLVFLDEHGIGSYIVDRLREQNQLVVGVTAADAFLKVSGSAYTMNPSDPNGYALLMGAMLPPRRPPLKVLHMWNLAGSTFVQQPWLIPEWGFQGLLRAAEHIQQSDGSLPPVEIISVANQQVELFAEGTVPRKSTALGALEAVAEAYPGVRCRLIDIDAPSEDADHKRRLAKDLLREVTSNRSEMLVAWRHRQRWVHDFAPASLPDAETGVSDLNERLRAGSVCIVFGSSRGPAPAIAQFLLRRAGAQVALVLPAGDQPQGDVATWLRSTFGSDGNNAPDASTGGPVLGRNGDASLLRADVSDVGQVMATLKWTNETLGEVRGLVFAADAAYPALLRDELQLDTVEATGAELEKLVEGLLMVDSAQGGKPVDFMLFASQSSVQADGRRRALERASKAFLDAYTHGRRTVHPGDLSTAIHFQGWQTADLAPQMQASDDNSRVEETLARVLSRDVAQTELVLSAGDPAELRQQRATGTGEATGFVAAKGHPRPELINPYQEPTTELQKQVVAIWERVLGIDGIGVTDNFFELGGDSLTSLRVMKLMQRELGTDTSAIVLFESPTIEAVCRVVDPDTEGEDDEEDLFAKARAQGARRRGRRRR